MVTLVPYSAGESPLREFNRCHDPESGRFATAGRCSAEDLHAVSRIRRDMRDPRANSQMTFMLQTRRVAMSGAEGSWPAYLQPDIARAKRDERTAVTSRLGNDPFADPTLRLISMARDPKKLTFGPGTKASAVSVLRHEIGHVEPRDLARKAYVAGLSQADLVKRLGPTGAGMLVEEIRAWRNAIVSGRGLVDWRTVTDGLTSHFTMKYAKIADWASKNVPAAKRQGKKDAKVVIQSLRRYARAVRSARRGSTVREFNSCHSPENGKFCATEGGGGSGLSGSGEGHVGEFAMSGGDAWYSFPRTSAWSAERVQSVSASRIQGVYEHYEPHRGVAATPEQITFLQGRVGVPARPGYLTVYRVGSKGGGLANRNAANLGGIARFVNQEGPGVLKGKYVTAYYVKAGTMMTGPRFYTSYTGA